MSCLLQFTLLAARDEDPRAVLHERLGGHLAEPSRAARHEHDVVAEVEKRGDSEVRGRRHFERVSMGRGVRMGRDNSFLFTFQRNYDYEIYLNGGARGVPEPSFINGKYAEVIESQSSLRYF
jgi:hypothetical protein